MRKTVVPKDVDEYLAAVPEPARAALMQVRATIRAAAPAEVTETISYGMPTFRYKRALMAYGAFTRHCSLFPMSLAVIASFKDQLKAFPTSKGTIHFTPDKPLPAALLKKMVKARVAEQDRKTR